MDIPIQREPEKVSPWFTKFVECFFAGVIAVNGTFLFLYLLPLGLLLKLQRVILLSFFGQFVLGIAAALVFSFPWHRRERRRRINSERVHAWLRGIMRYWLAFEICTYGFAKILHTQFAHSVVRDSTPVNQLNGFELTWNYFSHSYMMAVIIACMQIGGSVLLLFRRTTLLGVVILLPILLNIVLIDVFFQIPVGALLNAILFSLALIYLLLLRWAALVGLFLAPAGDLPVVWLAGWKKVFRLLAVGLAFGILFYAVSKRPVSPMAGKWSVDRLVRNRDTVKSTAWVTDSTAWTTLYIEERGGLAFCPNPYVYVPKRSEYFQYMFDSVRHEMSLILAANRKDTARFRVSHYDGRRMQWDGVFNDDTISMLVRREDE